MICVASAGNDGEQNPSIFPAGYLSEVIGVASTNNQDIRSTFSNYGSGLVDVAAPGEGDVTLYPGNNYAEGWGTSFSAPLVAGGAALLVQLGRHINEAQAAQAISQAIPTGQGLGAGELARLGTTRRRPALTWARRRVGMPAAGGRLLQKTMPGEDRAPRGPSLSPVSDDVCELFLVELQARRERLKHWIRLVSEEARLNGGSAPMVCGSRHKCRGTRIPPRAERRPGASRDSAAA